MTLLQEVRTLYEEYGQRKRMGVAAANPDLPHYFLHRTFLGEQDLLVIFNTKRCHYQCYFCDLPRKSSRFEVSSTSIVAQFRYVLFELKHSLSVLDRLTLSNEGSVLDSRTFPMDAMIAIVECSHELRRVRRLVLETRLEFVIPQTVKELHKANPRATIDILTGFETLDARTRDEILGKQESLDQFLSGLDMVAQSDAVLTAYVLFKPDPTMTDCEAMLEAERSVDFLTQQCKLRGIELTVRLNPMYAPRKAKWSLWAEQARHRGQYLPPRLTDVLTLAKKKASEGVRIYIGLSCEELAYPWGTYKAREDYSDALLKEAILFNNGRREPLST